MFFVLSKILHFLISPLTWVTLWGIAAWLSKSEKRRKRHLITAVLTLLFFGNSFILNLFLRQNEWSATAIDTVEKHEVGIVLGGFSTYDTQLDRLEFYESSDRLLAAVELYKKNKIDLILLSGGAAQLGDDKVYEMDHVKDWLIGIGIPKRDILSESNSRNTYENGVETMKILEAEELSPNDCLLITSATHMERALGVFKVLGADPTPFAVDRYSGAIRYKGLIESIVPNTEVIWRWEALIHEWVGRKVYRIKGYN